MKQTAVEKRLIKREKEISAEKARIAAIKLWRARIATLKMEKEIGVNAFCRKYGFDPSHLCHQMAGRSGSDKKLFDRIEKALAKEGV